MQAPADTRVTPASFGAVGWLNVAGQLEIADTYGYDADGNSVTIAGQRADGAAITAIYDRIDGVPWIAGDRTAAQGLLYGQNMRGFQAVQARSTFTARIGVDMPVPYTILAWVYWPLGATAAGVLNVVANYINGDICHSSDYYSFGNRKIYAGGVDRAIGPAPVLGRWTLEGCRVTANLTEAIRDGVPNGSYAGTTYTFGGRWRTLQGTSGTMLWLSDLAMFPSALSDANIAALAARGPIAL